ncbi:aminodeoxychorismate/anthranilate synthase component II [Fructilactobacillus lindneri]|uniref:anthranilate synthase component II n=1 Tax=Fructilactobacillus lindneri TaxID=53444 RepID=UPI000CD3B0ED|nr:aminodeoxychorismate/anthranilate synthase component II [Fructilactobacillus lindneri]POH05159.1 aminodeoxychorismate/anthranilate synthase component II [Fructilactobacillus lindneri]
MILLIDNYDSFTYNLYQLLGEFTTNIKVIKNDKLTCHEITELHPQAIILSPGPGNPNDAGVSLEVVENLQGKIPILGVCMGLQVIVQALGGEIIPAQTLMHGKTSNLSFTQTSTLFQGLPKNVTVARYHSLVGNRQNLTTELTVTAYDSQNEIMAVESKANQLYGVQFHPESILTDPKIGRGIVRNFLNEI